MFYVYFRYICHALSGFHTIFNAISEQAKGGASNVHVFPWCAINFDSFDPGRSEAYSLHQCYALIWSQMFVKYFSHECHRPHWTMSTLFQVLAWCVQFWPPVLSLPASVYVCMCVVVVVSWRSLRWNLIWKSNFTWFGACPCYKSATFWVKVSQLGTYMHIKTVKFPIDFGFDNHLASIWFKS